MSESINDRVTALESEMTSLRRKVDQVRVRQRRTDDSIVQLITSWQPFLLSVGEAVVETGKQNSIRVSVLKRIRKHMETIRGLLPYVSERADKE